MHWQYYDVGSVGKEDGADAPISSLPVLKGDSAVVSETITLSSALEALSPSLSIKVQFRLEG